ncbi:MAG: ribonuclease R [Bacteroidota bacterium]
MPRKNKRKTSISTSKKKNLKRKTKGKKASLDDFLSKQIMAFMKGRKNKTYTSKQVAAETGLWKDVNQSKIRSVMDKLAAKGELNYHDKGRYQLNTSSGSIVGTLQVIRSGAGFVIPEEGEDVYISAGNMNKALSGDTVQVRLVKKRRGDRREGEITKIIQRARIRFVGTIEDATKDSYFFIPDSQAITQDFYVHAKHLNGAKHGQKVEVELIKWENRSPEAKVIQVLGEQGENEAEMHAILLQYGFQLRFPKEVELEAEKIPEKITASEIAKRRDMREITTFTIDPVDAKDFDDALSFRVLDNGRYEVGVHIADVSHYVKMGSILDQEAFQRATSVYLVDRTVPMLPEKLSNGVCSLRPQEEKLTFSIIWELDEEARVHKEWIGRCVIFSDHRFHYEGAQEVIDGEKEGPFREELTTLNKLAYKLRDARMKQGSVKFESNEVKFQLDEDDKPVRVIRKVRKDTHKMIEDFMLLANRRVAMYAYGLFNDPPLPFVYRVHDQPNPEKLASLSRMASTFGHESNFETERGVAERLNQLLVSVENKPEQNIVETLAVRSMAKAEYSTNNIGHFGLGFHYYTHFTSPIRRYPDVMVHRLLENYLAQQYQENSQTLEAQAKHSSLRERTAAEAERASIKYKQVEFLEDKIGEEFEGVISGVIEKGIFVELVDNLCEGMILARNIEGDYYMFDADNYRLIGRNTAQVLQIGDKVKVEIAGTDLKRRTIDMLLVEKLEEK